MNMQQLITIVSTLVLFNRKARLVILPVLLFFTYNPGKFNTIDLALGIDTIGALGCLIAIATNPSLKKRPFAKKIAGGYFIFYAVFLSIRYINWFVSGSSIPFIFLVADDVKRFILPVFYLWAFSTDIKSLKDSRIVLYSFLVGGLAAALHGIAQYVLVILPKDPTPPDWAVFSISDPKLAVKRVMSDRVFGPTTYVSIFGRNMGFFCLLAIYAIFAAPFRLRLIYPIVLSIGALAVLATKSLGAGTMIIAGLLPYILKKKINVRVALTVSVVFLVILLYQNFYEPFSKKVTFAVTQTEESSAGSRVFIWQKYLGKLFSGTILTGSWTTGTLDSEWVVVLVNGGLLSFAALIFLFYRIYKVIDKIRTTPDNLNILPIVYLGISSMTLAALTAASSGSTLFTPKNGSIFCVLLAMFSRHAELTNVKSEAHKNAAKGV